VRDNRVFQVISDPQAFNSYAYSRNNPVLYVDPDGEVIQLFAIAAMVVYTLIETAQPVNAPAPETETQPAKTGNELTFDIAVTATEAAITKNALTNLAHSAFVSMTSDVAYDNLYDDTALTTQDSKKNNWDKGGGYDEIRWSSNDVAIYEFEDGTTMSLYPEAKSTGDPTIQLNHSGADIPNDKFRY
jgi:hypothetical protein